MVWHFMSGSHKVTTPLIVVLPSKCCYGEFPAISWIQLWRSKVSEYVCELLLLICLVLLLLLFFWSFRVGFCLFPVCWFIGSEISIPHVLFNTWIEILVIMRVSFLWHAAKALGSMRSLTLTYEDLSQATLSFDEGHLLGNGILGELYKGSLYDGTAIVVRRLQRGNLSKSCGGQLQALYRALHPNCLALRTDVKYKKSTFLVYDYVPNGSLEVALHGQSFFSGYTLAF